MSEEEAYAQNFEEAERERKPILCTSNSIEIISIDWVRGLRIPLVQSSTQLPNHPSPLAAYVLCTVNVTLGLLKRIWNIICNRSAVLNLFKRNFTPHFLEDNFVKLPCSWLLCKTWFYFTCFEFTILNQLNYYCTRMTYLARALAEPLGPCYRILQFT